MGFHRSISFSPSTSSSPSPRHQFSFTAAAIRSPIKNRSISLPAHSDPLTSHLEEHSRSVRSWARSNQSDSATRIVDGLLLLSCLLSSLLNLLRDPQNAESLRQQRFKKILEDLLRLADAHSCFRDGLLSLNQTVFETQAAVRHQDATRLVAAVRAQRRADRELSRLAASAREIALLSRISEGTVLTASICDAVAAAALASAGVFSCVVGMSVESVRDIGSVWDQWALCPIASPMRFSTPAASPVVKSGPTGTGKVWWVVDVLRWRWRSKKRHEMDRQIKEGSRGDASKWDEAKREDTERREVLQRLQALEKCIATAENGCAEIYRALMDARVTLLNVLTPTV